MMKDRFSLYILRNLVMATKNERILQEIGLRGPSDGLSYRVAVRSIERVADHAASIADLLSNVGMSVGWILFLFALFLPAEKSFSVHIPLFILFIASRLQARFNQNMKSKNRNTCRSDGMWKCHRYIVTHTEINGHHMYRRLSRLKALTAYRSRSVTTLSRK